MQIDTAAAIDLSKEKKQNESSFSDQMKAYIKHPGSGVLALLTLLGAVLTFALLFFLIGYILVKGVPYLSTDLFSLTYNSENLSLLPSLINTFILTIVSLVIAAPLGIFAAIYLVEYAKKGSKLVNVIRITAETLSGIPSIIFGLFGIGLLTMLTIFNACDTQDYGFPFTFPLIPFSKQCMRDVVTRVSFRKMQSGNFTINDAKFKD